MASESNLESLLRIADEFLTSNGFTKAAKKLQDESGKRGISLTTATESEAKLPTLDSLLSDWERQNASTGLVNGAAEDVSSSEPSSISSSESDSDSEESEVEAKTKSKAKSESRGTKRKRPSPSPSSSEPSSSSSDDDSSSASEGEGQAKAAPTVTVLSSRESSAVSEDEEMTSSASGIDSSSSDSSDDSSDDDDIDSTPDSSVESSDSDVSSSDASSASESEADNKPAKSKAKGKGKAVKKEEAKPKTTTQASKREDESPSSATLSGSPVIKQEEPEAVEEMGMHPDRKRKLDDTDMAAVQVIDGETGKRVKKVNVPFSRISKDQYVDPKLASNKFVPYDYAQRAHEKLIVTKGKGFTKEKNKGKRGSYRGGKIDLAAKGIKFED